MPTPAYTNLNSNKPAGTDSPTTYATDNLNNIRALRDMVITGRAAGFVQTRTQGTGPDVARPQYITWLNSTLQIGFRMKSTWGGTGNCQQTSVEWEWTNDNAASWTTLGTAQANTFDANDNITATTNSGGLVALVMEMWTKLLRYVGAIKVDAATNNVGLGTTPGEKLHVIGAITTGGQAAANKTSAGTFDFYATDNATRLLSWGSAGVGGRISFWTGNGGSGTTQHMVITSTGSLGIGTTAPGTKLHAFGRIRSSDTSSSGVSTASGVFELGDTGNGIWRGDANSITTAGNFTHLGGYDGILFTCSNHAIGSQTERLRITSDGRLYGTALHNNAGSVTGTATQYIASGTMANGNATAVTNVSGTPTYQTFTWMRVGNVVTCAGTVTAGATTANTACTIRFPLPIASGFTAIEDCAGTGIWTTGDNGEPVRVTADVTNDQASVRWVPTNTTITVIPIHFTYLIK